MCICSLGQTHEYTIEYICMNVLSDGQSSSWVLTFDPNFLKCDINGNKSSWDKQVFLQYFSTRLVPSLASLGFQTMNFLHFPSACTHCCPELAINKNWFFCPVAHLLPVNFVAPAESFLPEFLRTKKVSQSNSRQQKIVSSFHPNCRTKTFHVEAAVALTLEFQVGNPWFSHPLPPSGNVCKFGQNALPVFRYALL